MDKKVRLELTIEELNEVYYVLGMADLNRNLGMAKYNMIENLLDRIRETLNQNVTNGKKRD